MPQSVCFHASRQRYEIVSKASIYLGVFLTFANRNLVLRWGLESNINSFLKRTFAGLGHNCPSARECEHEL